MGLLTGNIFATGFENKTMGAVLSRGASFSSSITHTPGISLKFEDYNGAWVGYKNKLDINGGTYVSFAYRYSLDSVSLDDGRIYICEIVSGNRISLNWYDYGWRRFSGMRLFITPGKNLAWDLTTDPLDTGLRAPSASNFRALLIPMNCRLAENTWYWISCYFSIEVDDKVPPGSGCYNNLNGAVKVNDEFFGNYSATFELSALEAAQVNNLSKSPDYTILRGGTGYTAYFDNFVTADEEIPEGYSIG